MQFNKHTHTHTPSLVIALHLYMATNYYSQDGSPSAFGKEESETRRQLASILYAWMIDISRRPVQLASSSWRVGNSPELPYLGLTWTYMLCVCVRMFSSHSFWTSSSLDVPAGVTQEEDHTGFLIHLLSAVRALVFLGRRIQPFLSLVYREVEF